MQIFDIRLIDELHQSNINIRNDSFSLWGKLIPSFNDGTWNYSIFKYDENDIKEMTFPNENYQWEEMKDDFIFIGAYINDECVGLLILQRPLLKYLYVHDLKVNKAYR